MRIERLFTYTILSFALALGLSTTAKAQWTPEQKILAQLGAAFDGFGYSVSISGNTAIVGAYLDDDNGESSGSAYIFEKDLGGMDNWGQSARCTSSV